MKNLKSIIAVFAICFATISSFATETNDPIKDSRNLNLRAEIISILGSPANFEIDEASTAEIIFTVNDENQMIVISVNSENREFKNFVKRTLHNKKLDSGKLKARTVYTLPVQLKNI